jgi:protein phosphatase
MGSTIIAAVVLPSGAFVLAWVGDSRGYKVTPDALVHLHYVHNYSSERLKSGLYGGSEETAKKSRGSNILTRSLGRSNEKLRQDGGPEHIYAKLQIGERLLLCSDGVWGEMPDEILRTSVADADTPTTACSALLAAACDRGAEDNISAIVAELR